MKTSKRIPIPGYSGAGCTKILQHIREVWAGNDGEAAFSLIMAWLANTVQQPLGKLETSLMVYGDQGAGKSIIIEKVMAPILGTNHARLFAEANTAPVLRDDRQWTVLKVSEHRVGDRAYFNALTDEIEDGGVEAFHAYLMNPELLKGVDLREAIR